MAADSRRAEGRERGGFGYLRPSELGRAHPFAVRRRPLCHLWRRAVREHCAKARLAVPGPATPADLRSRARQDKAPGEQGSHSTLEADRRHLGEGGGALARSGARHGVDGEACSASSSPLGCPRRGRAAVRFQRQAMLVGQPVSVGADRLFAARRDVESLGRNRVGSINLAAALAEARDHDVWRARTRLRPFRVSSPGVTRHSDGTAWTAW